MTKQYDKFLKSKVVISEEFGFDTAPELISELCMPHQRDIEKEAAA